METREDTPEIGWAKRPDRADVVPWLLALGAPFAHLLIMAARYALVRPACGGGAARVLLELLGAVAVAATVLPGVLAWRRLGRDGRRTEADGPGHEGTVHLLLQLGVLVSAVFAVLALATWMPSWVLDACHR